MENSDRTLEMPAASFLDADSEIKQEGSPSDGARTPRATVDLSGEDTILAGSIPPGLQGRRPSPVLDPSKRIRVSRIAKWLLLVGILLLVAYIPLSTYDNIKAFSFCSPSRRRPCFRRSLQRDCRAHYCPVFLDAGTRPWKRSATGW